MGPGLKAGRLQSGCEGGVVAAAVVLEPELCQCFAYMTEREEVA